MTDESTQVRADKALLRRAKSKAAAEGRSLKSVVDDSLNAYLAEKPAEADGEIPAHLWPIWTDRGFKHMPTLRPSTGEEVKVFESSMAEGPYVWLTVKRSEDEATVHLTLGDAAKVRDQLDFLIHNHYQPETQ